VVGHLQWSLSSKFTTACIGEGILTRKLCCRKDDRAMRPIYGCPEKIRESLATPTATFPELVNWAFVVIDRMKVRTKFEVRSFTRS